jgi:hypothetical protein
MKYLQANRTPNTINLVYTYDLANSMYKQVRIEISRKACNKLTEKYNGTIYKLISWLGRL